MALRISVWAAAMMAMGLLGLATPEAQAQDQRSWRLVQAGPKNGARPRPGGPRRLPPGERRRPGSSADAPLNDTVLQLMQMPAARRRQALRSSPRFRSMPEHRRKELLGRLDRIDRMSVDQRELLMQRYEFFSRLRPEQQSRARILYKDWAQLPRSRRSLMTRGIQRLRQLPAQQRSAALESEAYTSRFSVSERKMLGELADLSEERDPSR